MKPIFSIVSVALCLCVSSCSDTRSPVDTHLTYRGTDGPGEGKHIVFIASDHEYRSEETLPALARILAKHQGFKCTVLFGTDPETGTIKFGDNNIPGMEALDTADLMVLFTRFQDWPKEQMDHFVAYLDRGGPVVGLRTATHAFKIPAESPFAKYDFKYAGEDYNLGFGRRVLGETWAGHYGKNHVQATRLDIVPGQESHPILRGVTKPWARSGGYFTDPEPDSTVLAMAQVLGGMTPDSPNDLSKPPVPGAWTRSYKSASGKEGRVFTSTYGASEDILDDGYRRLLINACLWAAGLEGKIKADADISFVGAYNPTTFGREGGRNGVKPSDIKGWDTPIFAKDAPFGRPAPPKKPKNKGKKK